MNPIVRRAQETPAIAQDSERLPPKSRRAEGIFVSSQLSLGVKPTLVLAWSVLPRLWAKGFSLMVFHSASEFSSEKYPADLSRHGNLIIEVSEDGCRDEYPAEGAHFYTFVLHKKGFLREKLSVLRFSETVPSAKVAIGRIQDKVALTELLQQHELGQIDHETNLMTAQLRQVDAKRRLDKALNPPPHDPDARSRNANPVVAGELAGIDAMVETLFAKRQKIAALREDAKFKNLSRKEQKEILKRINERLDAAEVSARQDEMRGS